MTMRVTVAETATSRREEITRLQAEQQRSSIQNALANINHQRSNLKLQALQLDEQEEQFQTQLDALDNARPAETSST